MMDQRFDGATDAALYMASGPLMRRLSTYRDATDDAAVIAMTGPTWTSTVRITRGDAIRSLCGPRSRSYFIDMVTRRVRFAYANLRARVFRIRTRP